MFDVFCGPVLWVEGCVQHDADAFAGGGVDVSCVGDEGSGDGVDDGGFS